jgi:hypothetical protein
MTRGVAAGRRAATTTSEIRSERSTCEFPYYWRVRKYQPDRYGQPCKITARGALNSIRVEFEDGHFVVTSGWNVRKRPAPWEEQT